MICYHVFHTPSLHLGRDWHSMVIDGLDQILGLSYITQSKTMINNYNASPNGRIWLVWDDNWYEVKMITSSAKILHSQVKERSKDYQFIVTVVYGFNTVEQRKSLWKEMQTISQGVIQPWLIVGDFNAILSTKDRLDGGLVTKNEIQDFGDCVRDMEVTELQWKGNYYTWNNKQCGEDRIESRIDTAFGNDEWMDKWGHVITKYENPNISDHSL